MKFNINNYVRVKLTEAGINHLKDTHQRYWKETGKIFKFEPKIDENGYTEFQLWDLISVFGTKIYNGSDLMFETEIEIPENGEI